MLHSTLVTPCSKGDTRACDMPGAIFSGFMTKQVTRHAPNVARDVHACAGGRGEELEEALLCPHPRPPHVRLNFVLAPPNNWCCSNNCATSGIMCLPSAALTAATPRCVPQVLQGQS